jgi:signal transduction histidine kinase
MKFLYICLALCLACLSAPAQDKKSVDSLRQAYTQARHDTMRIKLLMEIRDNYLNYYPDSTIAIGEKMRLIAERSHYEAGKIDAFNSLGIGYYTKGEKAKGIAYMQQALGIAEKLQIKSKLANCYSNLGNFYNLEGNYVLALEYYQKALKIYEAQGNKYGISTVLLNMANVFENQGEYAKGAFYAQKSFEIRNQLDDKQGIILALQFMAVLYDRQKQYALAVTHYKYALSFDNIMAPKQKATIQSNMAFAYMKQEKYDSAKIYFQTAFAKQEELKDYPKLIYTFDGLAKLSMRQGNYPQAVEYAQKGLAMAQQAKRTVVIKELSETLYLAYKGNKQSDKALEHYEVYKQIQDSLFTVDKAKAIANLEAKDELRRKQDAFTLLEKDKNLEIAQERNQKLALEKRREATELITLAKQEKDKRKQDSLYNLAQQKQLEADKFLAESKTQKLQILQAKEAKDAQQRVLYVVLAGLAIALFLAYLAYRSRQAEKRAKNEVEAQKEEITIQAKQLETANKTKDQLFSIIAHDLRSPMMAFQGLNKQIKFFLAKDRPEKLAQLGENIEKASTRLNSLLDNLLQWAMLQKQVIRTNPQLIDLQEAIAHSISHFNGLAQSQQITLHQQVGKESITTDYNILQTILRNLLSNALKFTPEGGEIELAYQREVFGGTPNTESGTPNKEQGILSVRDTGAGMSAEQVANLFQGIQFQSQQGLRGEKGTGLGLQLCYELAQQINATLTVESEEGKGTTFSLVLHDIQASQ